MADPQPSPTQPRPARRRGGGRIWPWVLGVVVVGIGLLAVFWRWDWLVPLVDRQASSALGRPVSIAHLHVRLGRVTTATADDVTVGNPQGFPQDAPLAHARTLTVGMDVWDYLRNRRLVFPLIALDSPDVAATALADGRSNYAFGGGGGDGKGGGGGSVLPQIDDLRITDGHVRFRNAALKADFTATVATRAPRRGEAAAPAGGPDGPRAAQGGDAARVTNAGPDDAKSDGARSDAAKSDATRPGTAASGETRSADAKPDEPKPGTHPDAAPAGTATSRAATTQGDTTQATAARDGDARGGTGATPVAGGGNDDQDARIVVDARGTYSGQPVTASFVGGALLTVMSQSRPYPVDLHVRNGDTRVALSGTVRDPLHFQGTNLRLDLRGSDMADLFPLTGIPIPHTPAYGIAGRLDYDTKTRAVRFHDFSGRVGNSDLEGTIDEVPGKERPDVTMDLSSHRVNLVDLGGFIGGTPESGRTPDQTAAQKKAVAQANARKTLLPDEPINFPKVRAADVHLKYHGEHIENTFVPLDDIRATLDLVDGKITLHPLDFGVGPGTIQSRITVDATREPARVDADVDFKRLSLARIMKATHAFVGNGTLDGGLVLRTTGNSMASMMGRGDGSMRLTMQGGGQLSALLLDLAGLEFGNAILSALHIPQKAQVQCFISDFDLKDGIAHTKVMLLQTSEARTVGRGDISFRNETLDYSLTTRSTHFSIGSLPGPINITGPLRSPTILPGAEVAGRAAAAVGLGILAGPAAILPTIQFGTGEGDACAKARAEAG